MLEFTNIAHFLSNMVLFSMVGGIPLYAVYKKVDVYDSFLTGAKDGFDICVRLIPFLVGFYIAIGMFRAAGGFEFLAYIFGPALYHLGVPVDLLPMMLIRRLLIQQRLM